MSCCFGVQGVVAHPVYKRNCPLLSVTVEVIKELAKTCFYLCAYLLCLKTSDEYKFHWLRSTTIIEYYWEFGSSIVNFSVNRKKPDTPQVEREAIAKTGLVSVDKIKPLTMDDGICYGAVHDFLSRFISYQSRGFTTAESVEKASDFFAHGGTKEAVLLQMLHSSHLVEEKKLLNHFQLKLSQTTTVPAADYSERLSSLKEGAYHISLKGGEAPTGHSLALIKGQENEYYLFEPNGACVQSNPESIATHLQQTGYEFAYFFEIS